MCWSFAFFYVVLLLIIWIAHAGSRAVPPRVLQASGSVASKMALLGADAM